MLDQSSRQARLERRREQQRRGQTKWIVYVVIGAAVVAALLIASNLMRKAAYGEVLTPAPRSYTLESGNVLGDPNAKVQFVEVGDFQCPACKVAYTNVEESIINDYVNTGKISYTFEAIAFIGPESTRAAEAAYCAADQNTFWEYHDYLYTNQGAENSGAFADDRLIQFAQAAGLDMNAFNACFQSGQKASRLRQAQQLATGWGVSNTPSFIINGTLVMAGVGSYAEIQQAIEAALAASGSQ